MSNEPENPANVANAVTLLGYGAGLAWIAGASPWYAVASVIADEVDGQVARERGEQTEFGGKLDRGVDLILAALTLRKLGAPWWTIPLATTAQVWIHREGHDDHGEPLGLRSILMLYGALKEARTK